MGVYPGKSVNYFCAVLKDAEKFSEVARVAEKTVEELDDDEADEDD